LEEQRICIEERMARDEPETSLDEQRAALLKSGHGVKYDTGKRRFYDGAVSREYHHQVVERKQKCIEETRAERDKYAAMCAKLAEALKCALYGLQWRRLLAGYVIASTRDLWAAEVETVEAALKEWEESCKQL
jgi:hypothetical protein